MAGLDVMRFLTTTDDSEAAMMAGIAIAVAQIREQEFEKLAVDIANNLGKVWGG
jgi:hypothetical protein